MGHCSAFLHKCGIAGSVADKKGVASTSMTVAADKGQEPKDSLAQGPHSAPAAGSSYFFF